MTKTLDNLRSELVAWLLSGEIQELGFPHAIESVEWTGPDDIVGAGWRRLTANIRADGKPFVFSGYVRRVGKHIQIERPSLILEGPMPEWPPLSA